MMHARCNKVHAMNMVYFDTRHQTIMAPFTLALVMSLLATAVSLEDDADIESDDFDVKPVGTEKRVYGGKEILPPPSRQEDILFVKRSKAFFFTKKVFQRLLSYRHHTLTKKYINCFFLFYFRYPLN